MSAVLQRTKQLYLTVIRLEAVVLVSFSALLGFFYTWLAGLSFLLGGLASFLPQCLFIFWVFFRQNAKNSPKMTAFYRGEGLKWLATIILIVLGLKIVPNLNVLLFFCGYFLFLVFNSLLPIVLKQRA